VKFELDKDGGIEKIPDNISLSDQEIPFVEMFGLESFDQYLTKLKWMGSKIMTLFKPEIEELK